MKYLNKYNDLPSYISAKQGEFAYPHVSLIAETGGVMYDPKQDEPVDYDHEYLTITALEDGCCVYFVKELGEEDGQYIYFSKDKTTWTSTQAKVPTITEIESSEEDQEGNEEESGRVITLSSPFITLNRGEKVYLKGTNSAYFDMNAEGMENIICMPSSNNNIVTTTVDHEPDPEEFSHPLYNIEGNIMSLLYGDNFIDQVTFGEENLGCLVGIFSLYGFEALNPYLYSCENLILPATTLMPYCYGMLFVYCTGLTIAPELPATTLTEACYYGMFKYCVSLTQAPILPAETLESYCYIEMFPGCMSLSRIECLATDISAEMCTENWTEEVAQTGTFIKNPEMTSWSIGGSGIPYGWTVEDAGVPAIKFTAVQANSTIGLAKLAEHQTLQYSTDDGETWNTFAINTLVNLEHIDDYIYVKGTLSDDNSTDDYTNFTVSGNVSVGGNINTLWGGQLYDYCGYSLFKNCTAVSDISELKLPASILTEGCYSRMFKSCTGLTETMPSLSATTLATDCYKEMFAGCSNLEEAPELQAITLAQGCYHGMFAECTSLEEAPELYAGVLVQSCYQNMFDGCSSLNYIKCHATDISATDCTTSWVKNVENSGTFYKYAKTNFTVNSVNGIPNGWTVSIMPIPAVKFTANEANSTVGLASQGAYHNLEYSEDGGDTWEEMTTETEITLENIEDSVYIRGILRQFDQQEHTFTQFSITGDVSLSGNANSLWNYLNMNNAVIMGCGYNLFKDCTGITDAHLLTLPTTNLTGKMACYLSMFEGCTSLISIPQLPATTLAAVCYSKMFSGCTSLTSTTQLPATTLAESCYNEMFKSCTSLTTAPQLSATTLAESCYNGMFRECTSLTTAPQLPATTLDRYCYSQMFYGCSSLTTAPQLSATNLEYSCYSQMFSGCTSLTTVPHITAITVMDYSCNGMFLDCKNLTAAPISLLATSLGQFCYSEMFRGCTSLIAAPELPATTLTYGCYQYMFTECTSLTQAPVLPATTLAEWCYSNMFAGCTSLVASPELLASQLVEGCYFSMFSNCSNLKEVICLATSIDPGNDSTTNWLTDVSSTGDFYKNMNMLDWETGDSGIPEGWNVSDFVPSSIKFKANQANSTIGLSNLGSNQFLEYSLDGEIWTSFSTNDTIILNNIDDYVYIRGELSSNNSQSDYTQFTMSGRISIIGNINYLWNENKNANLKDYCGYRLFANCSALVTAPQLPTKVMSSYCYSEMFSGCTELTTTPELPATTLSQGCYANMFNGCTSLTESPILSALSLSEGCYLGMFSGCTSLRKIECLATNISATNCTTGWATNVASSGIFTKAVNMNSWTVGTSGIPSGWEVDDRIDAIKFTANQANSTIGLLKLSTYQSMEYSVNGIDWNTFDTESTITLSNVSDYVFIRGTLENNASSENNTQFIINGNVTASGNLNTLWNYININNPLRSYCGYNLFYGCTGLANVTDLILPATSLANSCYYGMFYRCTSLTTSPQLPATSLASNCYTSMFSYCTSLTSAPQLPATTLAEGCYSNMFQTCISLTTAPQLSATNLSQSCYYYMFEGCTSLAVAPELPATNLADGCYNSMFRNCTSLITAPQLPATTLADYCYFGMFTNCTSLTVAPQLPATTLATSCYYEMFWGCTSLTTAPELPATTLVDYCYYKMFCNCGNINYIKCLASDTSSATDCTQDWTYGVSSTGIFYKSANKYWPTGEDGIPEYWTVEKYLPECIMFKPSNSISTIGLSRKSTNQTLEYSLDLGHTWNNLTTSDTITLNNSNGDIVFIRGILSGNNSQNDYTQFVTTGSDLVAEGKINYLWSRNINDPLKPYCGYHLFDGCNLMFAPELPTAVLTEGCYAYMFNGCSTLSALTCLATDITATDCTTNWVNNVASNGIFNKAINMDSWTIGANGIPRNWLVKESSIGAIKFKAVEPNSSIGLERIKSPYQTLEYSLDFVNWSTFDTTVNINLVNVNDSVYVRGILLSNTSIDYTQFKITGGVSVSGNINNLWNYNSPNNYRITWAAGENLFLDCTGLVDAFGLTLPTTVLNNSCYAGLFKRCTNLVNAPMYLPATVAGNLCYASMFEGCTSLVLPPIISLTKTVVQCCYYMFKDCTSLTTAPGLPATDLTNYCYDNMFNGCTSLTTAPQLPATNLAEGCYHCMFQGCTSLTTAPLLSATTLVSYCYYGMFYKCTNLSNITMLATDISATNCLMDWTINVAASGTFTKAASMTTLPTGSSGVPSGWTVEDYNE